MNIVSLAVIQNSFKLFRKHQNHELLKQFSADTYDFKPVPKLISKKLMQNEIINSKIRFGVRQTFLSNFSPEQMQLNRLGVRNEHFNGILVCTFPQKIKTRNLDPFTVSLTISCEIERILSLLISMICHG